MLVWGVGVNEYSGSINFNRKTIKSYKIWQSMLQRGYDEKYQLKYPTYIGCTVCDEWLYFSNFKQWFDDNYREGMHLDKDILVEGNKVYSPETCVFVPLYLNSLLTDSGSARGNLPLGVTKNGSSYQAKCSNGQGKQLTKTFKTIPEAQQWYSTTKTQVVKEQAIRAFMEGSIKTDVYLALVRRKF